jgi:hypothetical protein
VLCLLSSRDPMKCIASPSCLFLCLLSARDPLDSSPRLQYHLSSTRTRTTSPRLDCMRSLFSPVDVALLLLMLVRD